MRSDYWGQGGHNAILLVGDFFKSVLKSGLIDTKAKFPPPAHPPMPAASWPSDHWSIEASGDPAGAPDPTQPTEVIVRQDGSGSIVIGDKASVTTSRHAPGYDPPPKSAAELDRVLQNMGRDSAGKELRGNGALSSGTGSSEAPAIDTPPPTQ